MQLSRMFPAAARGHKGSHDGLCPGVVWSIVFKRRKEGASFRRGLRIWTRTGRRAMAAGSCSCILQNSCTSTGTVSFSETSWAKMRHSAVTALPIHKYRYAAENATAVHQLLDALSRHLMQEEVTNMKQRMHAVLRNHFGSLCRA